jgi:2-methylfumaryl-CoA isomerase
LRAHRADLIHVHIRGHSEGAAAVDYTINSEVGLPLITGPEESSRPVNHVLPAWDLLTGLHAGIAIVAAERERARTGAGQAITISLADVALATMGHLGFIADVAVNGHGRLREGNYLYGSFGCDFETGDGHRVMVVALTPRHWKHLVDVTGVGAVITALEQSLGVDLGREEERYRHREVLTGLLRPWFASHTVDEVEKELDTRGVLWGRYRTVDELVRSSDSLLARSPIFEELDHAGVGTYPVPGSVLRPAMGSLPPRTASEVGADTDEVLADLLGLDRDAVRTLRKARVIGGAPEDE